MNANPLISAAAVAVAAIVIVPQARAQLSCPCEVFDPGTEANTGAAASSTAQTLIQELQQVQDWVQQAQQMETQITQATNLFNHLNELTNPNQFAAALSAPLLRQYLPTDLGQIANLVQPSNGSYSQLNTSAQQFRSVNRSYTQITPTTSYDQFRQNTFESKGNTIATAFTEAQAVFTAATQRLQGLETLRLQLDSSVDDKQTADLHARIGAEQADMQNDIMRLQGLEMMMKMQLASADQQEREATYQFHQNRIAAFGSQQTGTRQ